MQSQMYRTLLRLEENERDLLLSRKTVDEAKGHYCLNICKYKKCKDEFNVECNILKPFMNLFEYMLEGKLEWKYEKGEWKK